MTVIRHRTLQFAHLPGRSAADPLLHVAAASSVRIVTLDGATRRQAHRHPHSEELMLIVAGHGVVWIDGMAEPVGPGDVVHVPAAAAHATLCQAGTAMEIACFFPHPDLDANQIETDQIVEAPAATRPGEDTAS